jgi:hypothetical protein
MAANILKIIKRLSSPGSAKLKEVYENLFRNCEIMLKIIAANKR